MYDLQWYRSITVIYTAYNAVGIFVYKYAYVIDLTTNFLLELRDVYAKDFNLKWCLEMNRCPYNFSHSTFNAIKTMDFFLRFK